MRLSKSDPFPEDTYGFSIAFIDLQMAYMILQWRTTNLKWT